MLVNHSRYETVRKDSCHLDRRIAIRKAGGNAEWRDPLFCAGMCWIGAALG
jgi:hypothetical protein